jgi:UPF0755 protein
VTDDTSMLDLAIDDRPPRRRFPRGFGPLLVLAALVVIVGVALAGGRTLLSAFDRDAPDYSGAGTGEVVVQVEAGASSADIGAELKAKDVVKSSAAFVAAARDDDRSRTIQPGFYRMRTQMKAQLALELMLDPKSRVRSRFTVPEGTTVARTLEIIAKSVDDLPIADLKAAAANPAALGLPTWAEGRLEGMLFPATYDVEPGTSAVEVLSDMVSRFLVAAAESDLEGRAAELGMKPYDLLIIASLVEAETPKDDQRAKVSRVVFNRLAKNMRLEFDSTIKYAYGLRGVVKTRLLFKDLELDSPYNSYRRAGLPPTPINSPGEAAILAAAEPEPGPWLYFVVIDKEGNSAFSDNYQQFLRDKERYRREVLGEG